MKNKIFLFLILFFIEGFFISLQAMPPMFSEKGEWPERKTTEEQREREDLEEQRRTILGDDADDIHNDSSTVKRGSLLREEDQKQDEESCEEMSEVIKILSMNAIVEEANNFQNPELWTSFIEAAKHNTTAEKETLGNFKGTSMEVVPVNSPHHPNDSNIDGLKSGYQELKEAECASKKVSFILPSMMKESPAEVISASQEFINKTSLDFTNVRKELSKALRSLPKNDTDKQDPELVAAHYKRAYDQAATLLRNILSELEKNPTLYDEQTALLLADMMIKTIQMAAQSVPLEKVRPLRGRVAPNKDRNIKIPFEVVSERSSIVDEESKLVANSAEHVLKCLQEAKEFLKSAADYSPDELGEKFHWLCLNKSDRVSSLLTQKTIIASLKCRSFQAMESTQKNSINIRAQLEKERRLAYDEANEHDQLLQELFNTPANTDLNQAKKEIIEDILKLAASRLKAADELIQMMVLRKEN